MVLALAAGRAYACCILQIVGRLAAKNAGLSDVIFSLVNDELIVPLNVYRNALSHNARQWLMH